MKRRTPILGLCLLLACSEAPTTPAGDPQPLPTLTVIPAQAAPGAVVSVSGVDVTALSGPVSVMIDGRESRTIVAADGSVLAVVPLYVESDGTVLAPRPRRST